MRAHDLMLADRFFDRSPLEWTTIGFASLGVVILSATVGCVVAMFVARWLSGH